VFNTEKENGTKVSRLKAKNGSHGHTGLLILLTLGFGGLLLGAMMVCKKAYNHLKN